MFLERLTAKPGTYHSRIFCGLYHRVALVHCHSLKTLKAILYIGRPQRCSTHTCTQWYLNLSPKTVNGTVWINVWKSVIGNQMPFFCDFMCYLKQYSGYMETFSEDDWWCTQRHPRYRSINKILCKSLQACVVGHEKQNINSCVLEGTACIRVRERINREAGQEAKFN